MSLKSKNNTVWGRAEYFDGQNWNEICDDHFSDKNAQVFCKSVGLPSQNATWANAFDVHFKYSNIPYKTGEFYSYNHTECIGVESSLDKCKPVSGARCTGTESVWVTCN